MKVNNNSASRRTRGPLGRMLACLLLAAVVYSASFGTVHSHGNASRSLLAQASASYAGPASASSNVPSRGDSDTDGCLICALHRQLSNSTVDAPHFNIRPLTEITVAHEEAIFHHSDPIVSSPITRQSGRAPPLA